MNSFAMCRMLIVLHVGCDGAKAILKDGRVITLSYDGCELRDLLLSQVFTLHISDQSFAYSEYLKHFNLSICLVQSVNVTLVFIIFLFAILLCSVVIFL